MYICKIKGANFLIITFGTCVRTGIFYGQNFLTISLELMLQKIKETVGGLRVNKIIYKINFLIIYLLWSIFFLFWGGGGLFGLPLDILLGLFGLLSEILLGSLGYIEKFYLGSLGYIGKWNWRFCGKKYWPHCLAISCGLSSWILP